MDDILPLATRIVRKLASAGYIAYFAGGWVRDFLLDHPSDDIDIATSAPPHTILDLFPRTIRVGVAFGVVIVDMEGKQFEVATFRRDLSYTNGRKPDKVEMSSPEEDAHRRDFTVNGMFYDPLEEKIYDYVGGMHDLNLGVIRAIGDPYERFKEDKLRMIRAVRFAHRFNFVIDPATQEAIKENCETLFPAVAMERIWQEICKMSQSPLFDRAVLMLHRFGLLSVIFPRFKGVHLNDIKHRVAPFHVFPRHSPPLLYLMQLFSDISREEMLEICEYLKLSGADKKLAETWMVLRNYTLQENNNNSPSPYQWAHFYADPRSCLCLEVYAATLPLTESQDFIHKHHQRKDCLKVHIDKIIQKAPLITSKHLLAAGIQPGALMGRLMKEGEKIAINCNYSDPQAVLKILQESSAWPNQ